MKQESITIRQGQSLLALFILGSALVLGVSANAGNDAWVSLVMSTLMALPILCIYARIMKLYPEMDLFDILEALFGKFGGKVLTALMTWYALHLCSLVLRNFTEFVQITAMPETPQLPVMIMLFAITAYLARSGLKTFGKWSFPMLLLVVIILGITIVFSFGKMDLSNIQPLFSHSFGLIFQGALYIYSFPLVETVLFLCVAKGFSKGDSPYRLYLVPLLFGAFLLLLAMLRNLFLMGSPMLGIEYFPSFSAARLIDIGDFLTRIEGTISINFIIGGITKLVLCLMAASRGMARLTGIENHKILILPMGLVAVALASILYQSVMEMFGFIPYYWVYAMPFQVFIPLLVWIVAEIKKKKPRNSVLPTAGNAAAGD